MTTLSVWKFHRPDGASQALRTLRELAEDGSIVLDDAAYVEWPIGRRKPVTRQLHDDLGRDALGGAFWGLLFGLLFFVPLIGAALGAGGGALASSLSHVGIDEAFITKVKKSVTEGTSGLFLLSSAAIEGQVRQRFAGTEAELIYTDLDALKEARLREFFGLH